MIFSALIADRDHPLPPHWTCAGSALAANDRPTDAREVELPEPFQKWFNGQEPDSSWSILQMSDSGQTILLIFDANPPPDVILFGGELQGPAQQISKPLRSFGEHLKCVPPRRNHDAADSLNVAVRNPVLKQIAHRIH